MAEVEIAYSALTKIKDFDVLTPGDGARILDAVHFLVDNPLVGAIVKRNRREIVIGYGQYVALYRYDEPLEIVAVLAVTRHGSQSEYGPGRLRGTVTELVDIVAPIGERWEAEMDLEELPPHSRRIQEEVIQSLEHGKKKQPTLGRSTRRCSPTDRRRGGR